MKEKFRSQKSLLDKVKTYSTCERRQVAAVIRNTYDEIQGLGYNKVILGNYYCCRRKSCTPGEDLNNCNAVHAEVMAIIDAARRNKCIKGATIYITHFPCENCMRIIAASGIKNIIYYEEYTNDKNEALKIAERYNINIIKKD